LEKADVQNHNDEGMTKQTLNQNRLPLAEQSVAQEQRSTSRHCEEEHILHPETPDDHPVS